MKKIPTLEARGRKGGRANTAAQRAQRQAAAKLAGRPRRVCTRCAQPVVGGHVDRGLDQSCGAHGWRWERAGVRHPAPKGRDAAALDQIAALLADCVRRDMDPSFGAIAHVLRGTGRRVR